MATTPQSPPPLLLLHHLLLLLIAVAALIPAARSQAACRRSQTALNQTFANCLDLPTLRASLHWTYNPSARPGPALDIAFSAPPASPAGWVAWGLNPTGSGMVGTQALLAFRDAANGSAPVVRTYNISSFGSVGAAESRIAYDVLRRRAEFSGGEMRIFATLAMPAGGAAEVINHVWQVGAAVSGGVPARHAFAPENLNSMGTLRLGGAAAEAPAPASGGGVGPNEGGNDSGGSWRNVGGGLGLYGGLVLLGVILGF